MNLRCPYCGLEMEKGYIQARDGISWNKKIVPIAALASLHPSAVILTSGGFPFSGSSVEAYHCLNCKKIVIDYASFQRT